VSIFDPENLLIVHTTSNYAGNPEELNLSMIYTLKNEFGGVIGYSGHEDGIAPTIASRCHGCVLCGTSHYLGPGHVGQ
jgi:N-acetylneuraminate synthase